MKNNSRIIRSLLCVALIAFSVNLFASNTVEGNGNIVTRQIDVTAFDVVSHALSATVNYKVSDEYTCTVRMDENLLEYLEIYVKDNDLKLGFVKSQEGVSINPTEFVIEVSAPSLKKVKIAGIGSFSFLTPFRAEKLEIDIAGAGDVYVGSGSVTKMKVNIAGSGSLESYCDTSEMNANIAGSGNITANVGTNLFYNIAGSGNLYYYGTPNLRGKKVGSGTLQQLED